jgi:hypothetical protein
MPDVPAVPTATSVPAVPSTTSVPAALAVPSTATTAGESAGEKANVPGAAGPCADDGSEAVESAGGAGKSGNSDGCGVTGTADCGEIANGERPHMWMPVYDTSVDAAEEARIVAAYKRAEQFKAPPGFNGVRVNVDGKTRRQMTMLEGYLGTVLWSIKVVLAVDYSPRHASYPCEGTELFDVFCSTRFFEYVHSALCKVGRQDHPYHWKFSADQLSPAQQLLVLNDETAGAFAFATETGELIETVPKALMRAEARTTLAMRRAEDATKDRLQKARAEKAAAQAAAALQAKQQAEAELQAQQQAVRQAILQDEANKTAKDAELIEARQAAAALKVELESLRTALRDMLMKPEFLPPTSMVSSASQAETETEAGATA